MNIHPSLILVDDNKASNFYHRIMMEEAGYNMQNVKEFLYANEALDHIKKILEEKDLDQIPDFILLDINMPIKSGWEMIKELKAFDFMGKQPKIYMVSNSRHPTDIEKAEAEPYIIGLFEKHLELDFFMDLKKNFTDQ